MSSIDVFWQYLYKYHPKLVQKDWFMDSNVIHRTDIISNAVKETVPTDINRLKCNVFFYEGGKKNIVFLIQDERGENNIVIGLLTNGELIHSINL